MLLLQPFPTVSAVAAGHSAIVLFALSVEATVRADHLLLVMKATLILLSYNCNAYLSIVVDLAAAARGTEEGSAVLA
ncbi:hypothetical protein [Candidatus Cardinium hertigii]|uniref:hypothetical protein n=1 Tax=Candidatus Cardinium hertigii TaxID=247481 RepID=UPI000D707E7F|nr:hypothetical protein [Candidatus Cardinium hertigii]